MQVTINSESVPLSPTAKCLALASVLVILGTPPMHGAEAARPGIAECSPGAGCPATPSRGVTVYRGLVLDYEVIDGMAVHGGDIVLGTAAEAAAAAPAREPAEPERSAGPARRDISGAHSSNLWPGGRVPYEIDERIEGRDLEDIHAALEEWNSRTVIEFFPRTDEEQYALIAPGGCRSGVGRGSPTTVLAAPCGLGGAIHELGHAVGLWHEHQRADRDRFLVVPPERARRISDWWSSTVYPTFTGPYDYGSVMHYGLFRGAFSIPPGLPVGSGRLSAGDIDGVARLYGEPPGAVTVATNPPGLQLIVDGESVTAPATFDWLPGSVHTLEAPLVNDRDSPQYVFDRDGRPYVFGRWSDGGDRERTITVDVADSTWFEANYIRSVRVEIAASPADSGTVALAPESPDGWYPMDSPVDATLIPAGGRELARYSSTNSDYEMRRVGERQFRIIPRRDLWMEALFRMPPLYRINSIVEGLGFSVGNWSGSSWWQRWRTPSAFQPSYFNRDVAIRVAEFPEHIDGGEETDASGGRYRFSGWSDGVEIEVKGGSIERDAPEVPAGGGSLTMQVQREFELVTDPSFGVEIVVSPASEDGYYPSGSQVQLTAIPVAGRYFMGWEDGGTETTRSVIMDRDRAVGATTLPFEPVLVRPGEPVQAAPLGGSHYFRVPEGTSEAAVRFESAMRDAEFQISGTHGSPLLGLTNPSRGDTITLTREVLTRWLDAVGYAPGRRGPYLRVEGRGSAGRSGTLHVTIQRDWIGAVWPPAFTFVSAAGWSRALRQTLRVTPVAGELPPVRYRIVSDSHWLEAFPPEWTGAQGEAEIAVTANGAALGAEAYGGKLKILILRDGDAAAGWTPTGIEIPVHFVVKPPTGAGVPTGGGSSGLAGGDDHGDTREAATELAAGAAARGRLERVGDEDWFRFRTTAAHTRVTAYTVSDGDTTGELHVAGSDSPLADDDAGGGANFRIATSVPAGTHYLRVRGFGTADYALTLEAVPDDHGDTRELATELAVGGSARGRIDAVGDEDWFRFRTTAATTWVTARAESDGDTAGELHVARGATAAGDYAGTGGNFRITAGVPAGTHYLRVSGPGTADYTLTLRETLDAMEFARIPAGSFVMGSPEDEEGRENHETQHEVQISRGFWMGKYEVTQGEWEALMGSNPSRYSECGAQCPVQNVSWEDAQEFIRKLNEREAGKGYRYRLPTEAEWEYAARAGTTEATPEGDLRILGEMNAPVLDGQAWYGGNSGVSYKGSMGCSRWKERQYEAERCGTHPVGMKRANAWGLHDMLGNVWERTADWYGRYPSGWVTDPTGPSTGRIRVVRGGAFLDRARHVRSAYRGLFGGGYRVGFRVVRTELDDSSGHPGADDHGDTRGLATEVAVGDSVQGRIERIGDEDWFRFRTTAVRTWVTAHAESEGVTVVEVHAAGAPLADGDAGGGYGRSPRSVAAVPAGTHYLRVLGFGTPDYTLTLQETLDAMEFARIPAGSFVMGSPEDEEGRRDDETQHEVTLSRGFWMGKHEVTQGEWEALMGSNPSHFSECGAQCPVETVSWEDAQEFLRRLNERESAAGSSARYRLPTEAEWEYAARAGTTGARYGEADAIAWTLINSLRRTHPRQRQPHPVGQKRANAWGLHDMLGNVREWTADWYGRYPSGAVTDPTGPSTGRSRVHRGGSWHQREWRARSADRYHQSPGYRHIAFGFRLVRTD